LPLRDRARCLSAIIVTQKIGDIARRLHDIEHMNACRRAGPSFAGARLRTYPSEMAKRMSH
jgi:hypothetical protein